MNPAYQRRESMASPRNMNWKISVDPEVAKNQFFKDVENHLQSFKSTSAQFS